MSAILVQSLPGLPCGAHPSSISTFTNLPSGHASRHQDVRPGQSRTNRRPAPCPRRGEHSAVRRQRQDAAVDLERPERIPFRRGDQSPVGRSNPVGGPVSNPASLRHGGGAVPVTDNLGVGQRPMGLSFASSPRRCKRSGVASALLVWIAARVCAASRTSDPSWVPVGRPCGRARSAEAEETCVRATVAAATSGWAEHDTIEGCCE